MSTTDDHNIATPNVLRLCALLAGLLCATNLQAQGFGPRAEPLRGRYGFTVVGASLTDSEGLNNGVNCLKDRATAEVARQDIPPRAKLVSATLYVAGSLIDDGIDRVATESTSEERIFDTRDLSYGISADADGLRLIALTEADREVSFHPPGSLQPINISTTTDSIAVAGFREETQPSHNVAFFVSSFDVTDLLNDKDQGRGVLDGEYAVAGVRADVCFGLEASCTDGTTCDEMSATHPKGAASWALLLIFEDPELPLAAISVYEGLKFFFETQLKQDLDLGKGSQVANPAAGRLAFYALEGDLREGAPSVDGPCGADEYIEVDGDADPRSGGLCLTDSDNPVGNIFNSTINRIASTPDPGRCAPNYQCCFGPGLCGETGTDIDTFDISAGLEPGADRIQLRFGSGTDHVGLALVVLSVNLFEPVLALDSRIEVIGATPLGRVQLEAPYEYAIAISNTGNSPARDVKIRMDAPRATEWIEVLSTPEGSKDLSLVTGGANKTGLLRIEDFDVGPGDIAEVRLRLKPSCGATGRTLNARADISWTIRDFGTPEVEVFSVDAPGVTARGPGIDTCPNEDKFGPFALDSIVLRRLRGGGGCAGIEATSWGLGLMTVLCALLWRRRKRHRAPHRGGWL